MAFDTNYLQECIYKLDALIIYKNVSQDDVLVKLRRLCVYFVQKKSYDEISTGYIEFATAIIKKAEEHGFQGNIFRQYVALLFIEDVNLFSLGCERKEKNPNSTLYQMVNFEMDMFSFLLSFDIDGLVAYAGQAAPLGDYMPLNPKENNVLGQFTDNTKPADLMNYLIWQYENVGCGEIGKSNILRYAPEVGILPIKNSDPVTLDDIFGYEMQKEMLINNTDAFMNGFPANNVLLVGHRGTGKSSCVKALANKYYKDGLRILEFTTDQIEYIPSVLEELRTRGKRFIIFIDELSFQEDETKYKHLKFLLEGTAESRPSNVLFYATSNRRHLVEEKWADKAGDSTSDEIHTTDTVNEKLSLSDRFGVTISFDMVSKDEYLKMVLKMAKSANIPISEDFLVQQSLQWEVEQNGISGRTARQFINNVIWNMQKM